MAIITLRIPKGSPLTNQEADSNFSNINTELGTVNSNVGPVSLLDTTVKSNIVFAVNEIYLRATTSANITGGNITGVANIASSDNVYAANYFIGNGSLLTGIVVDSTRIASGNTDLSIPGANGNFICNVAGNTMFTLSSIDAFANLHINGNIFASTVKTTSLQDSVGRTLRILDESNVVLWGG